MLFHSWKVNGPAFSLLRMNSDNHLSAAQLVFRRRRWHPTPVLLPGKSHGRRGLVGCSPWGHWELDTTERLHFIFSLSCTGEGNGNPLQCSWNPRDGGAWWAAVYGVAQSWTRLKWLSSSSNLFSPRTTSQVESEAPPTPARGQMCRVWPVVCQAERPPHPFLPQGPHFDPKSFSHQSAQLLRSPLWVSICTSVSAIHSLCWWKARCGYTE